MTVLNPPNWLENSDQHKSQPMRLLTSVIVPHGGVAAEGDLAVTQRAAGANMSVDVAAGQVFMEGSEQTLQGTYHGINDGTINRAVAPADGANARIDLVVAVTRDQFFSGAVNEWDVELITGDAGTGNEPAVPDNAEVLARIDVPAGAASITDADITDRRRTTGPGNGVYVKRVTTVKFEADGSFNKADHPGLLAVRVRLVGGGGGGVGNGSGNGTGGPGGGSGGYAEAFVDVDELAASESVTVGAGGAGSSGFATATSGGASSFGAHAAAAGGNGGGANSLGGTPGSGTSGDILLDGEPGQSTSDQGSSNLPGGIWAAAPTWVGGGDVAALDAVQTNQGRPVSGMAVVVAAGSGSTR